MIHQLKCEAKYFEDVCSGNKTFEVRKNDRGFHVGDYLALNELTPKLAMIKGKKGKQEEVRYSAFIICSTTQGLQKKAM